MAANLLQSYSIGRLNGERRYLRDNKYTSIGYFCESPTDTCGHEFPMSLFNLEVIKKGIITIKMSPGFLMAAGTMPNLFLSYISSSYEMDPYRRGSLKVCDVNAEIDSIEREGGGFNEKNLLQGFGDLPLKFGVYEIFVLGKYEESLVNKIEKEFPKFNVERNTSKALLEGVILQT